MANNTADEFAVELLRGNKTWNYTCERATNAVHALHSVRPLTSSRFKGELINGCTIWEMNNGVTLEPHVDASHNTSFVILPIAGRTKTSMHGQLPNDVSNHGRTPTFPIDTPIVDSITYGPGEFIVINNTKYIHSVTPIDDYRLVLQFNAESF